MKAYTSLEQAKKLAEILPIESADMCYVIDYAESNKHKTDHFKLEVDTYGLKVQTRDNIPCWSLAALLCVIKPINENTYTIIGTLDGGATISFDEITNVMFQEEEIIDAVFEMVVWLKKNGKI